MTEGRWNSRNEALVFAQHARKNLFFIENAAEGGAEVHPVTQLTVSLLGLIVFPKEKLKLDAVKATTLAELASEGWPRWNITRDDAKPPTRTLNDLLRHLRNAVAHGRLTFTSDSNRLDEVALIVEDKAKRWDPAPNWCAEIQAKDLRGFCLSFLDKIERTVE